MIIAKCHPLEGPCQLPTPLPSGSWSFPGGRSSRESTSCSLRGCAPVFSFVRCGDPHQPPIGIKVPEPGTGSGTPGTVMCPQKILGSRSCPRLEDSRSELPRRTGRQHLVARDLGASPTKSRTAGSRGSIRQRWFDPGTCRSSLSPAEINQRLVWPGTAPGRASRRSRRGPFCGLPPAGPRAGRSEPFSVRSTSWPAARTGWRSVRPR